MRNTTKKITQILGRKSTDNYLIAGEMDRGSAKNKYKKWRILHGRAGIRMLSSSERYFQHEKIKLVSPSDHIMLCLFYRY